jgi:hypothetical protein
MIVISSSLALSPTADNPLNTPVFGWDSLITTGNITATSSDADRPVTNLANPSTALRWMAAEEGSPLGPPAADQYITVTISQVDPIDYLAIAVHNLGSGSNPVSVEGTTDLDASPVLWTELITPRMLANDDPVIFRFTPQSLAAIRLRIQPSMATVPTTPILGVMYVSKLLVSPRGTHQDYTPINLAKSVTAPIGVSENGQFLGRVVISQSRASPFALKHLTPTFYREEMQPMIDASKDTPLFFAWKPTEFPNDMGFVFITNDPMPSRSFDTGRMAVEFSMMGVAV